MDWAFGWVSFLGMLLERMFPILVGKARPLFSVPSLNAAYKSWVHINFKRKEMCMTEEGRYQLHHAVEMARYALKALITNAVNYSVMLDNVSREIVAENARSTADLLNDGYVVASIVKQRADLFSTSQRILFDVALASLDDMAVDELEGCIESYSRKAGHIRLF
jgi:hypothetical protein